MTIGCDVTAPPPPRVTVAPSERVPRPRLVSPPLERPPAPTRDGTRDGIALLVALAVGLAVAVAATHEKAIVWLVIGVTLTAVRVALRFLLPDE